MDGEHCACTSAPGILLVCPHAWDPRVAPRAQVPAVSMFVAGVRHMALSCSRIGSCRGVFLQVHITVYVNSITYFQCNGRVWIIRDIVDPRGPTYLWLLRYVLRYLCTYVSSHVGKW